MSDQLKADVQKLAQELLPPPNHWPPVIEEDGRIQKNYFGDVCMSVIWGHEAHYTTPRIGGLEFDAYLELECLLSIGIGIGAKVVTPTAFGLTGSINDEFRHNGLGAWVPKKDLERIYNHLSQMSSEELLGHVNFAIDTDHLFSIRSNLQMNLFFRVFIDGMKLPESEQVRRLYLARILLEKITRLEPIFDQLEQIAREGIEHIPTYLLHESSAS